MAGSKLDTSTFVSSYLPKPLLGSYSLSPAGAVVSVAGAELSAVGIELSFFSPPQEVRASAKTPDDALALLKSGNQRFN